MSEFSKANLLPGFGFIGALALVSMIQGYLYYQGDTSCSLDDFAGAAVSAWEQNGKLANSSCYQKHFRDRSDLEFSRSHARRIEAELAKTRPRVGYKIGGHDPVLRSKIGLSEALFGVFYGEDSFLESGAKVNIDGQTLNFEPDLLLRVGDDRIMEAKSAEDIAQYIDRVFAFIELPVLIVDPAEEKFTFPYLMQATNLGARYGVIGEYVDTASDPDLYADLRDLTVVASNEDGTQRSIFNSLDKESVHVFEAAVQAAEHLRGRGEALRKGDLISVGALMQEFLDIPAENDGTRHVHYYIGDRDPLHVSVKF
ncbi:MAG: hypothetical protein AAGA23_23545 [Pseudomonadota bacterium]